MRLFPFERLSLRADSPPEAVEAKLADLVGQRRFTFRPPPEPFVGTVRGRHFKVVRVRRTVRGLRARSSSSPVVIGDIVPAHAGAEIRVRIRLSVASIVFAAFWFGALLLIAGALLTKGLREGFGRLPASRGRETTGAGGALLFVLAMIVMGYTIVTVSYRTEARLVREALCEGLGCRELQPNRLLRG
jgi:hypothetical protein